MSHYNGIDAYEQFYDMKDQIYRELVKVNFNLNDNDIFNLTKKLHEENQEMEEWLIENLIKEQLDAIQN